MFIAEILSTRETAWAIWITIACIGLLCSKNTRSSFFEVIKAFFVWKMLKWWLAMVLYFTAFLVLFYQLGLWTPDLLKDSVLYVLFSASLLFFRANKIADEPHFFFELIKDNLKIAIIFEFLKDLYTFDLWVELLIIPFAVMLTGMQVFSGNDAKYAPVKKLVSRLLLIGGLVILYHVVDSVILHRNELISRDNLRQILLTPNLTIVYIPFLYGLSLYIVYEMQFIVLGFKVENEALKRFSRCQAILSFRTDTESLKRWVVRWNLSRPQTEEEVIKTIKDLKEQQQLENSPPTIPQEQGWSPYQAKDFLPDKKLKAGYYDPGYEQEWTARSGQLRIDKDWSGNAISYRVKGSRFAVHELELCLAVYEPTTAAEILELYFNRVAYLMKIATGTELPSKAVKSIEKNQKIKLKQGLYIATLEQIRWGNSTNGYDLIFSIQINDHD